MDHKKSITRLAILFTALYLCLSTFSFAQRHELIPNLPKDGQIYLNPELGSDNNNGQKEAPLRTLYEAARRVNAANGKGAITILLSEGVYGLDATVTFHPANWWFSKTERLTIRSEVLPDEPAWGPAK